MKEKLKLPGLSFTIQHVQAWPSKRDIGQLRYEGETNLIARVIITTQHMQAWPSKRDIGQLRYEVNLPGLSFTTQHV